MSKKTKKMMSMLFVVALVAIIGVAGMLAYLSSEDNDVNVMTLGNVDIEQHEYERVQKDDGTYEMVTSPKYGEGYKLQEFTQAKPLYPATGAITGWGTIVPFDQIEGASGGQKVFAGLNNVQDKFVLVENTGTSDAYVRTLIALEYGSNTKDIVGISRGDFWSWNDLGVIEIEGNNYDVFEGVYKGSDTRHQGGVLPAGEFTYNSLGQIYLANEATNEDCEALDGNKNGTYDILVLSQAVQTNGFADAKTALDTAFGKATAANVAGWFGGMKAPVLLDSKDELKAAIANGEKDVLVKGATFDEKLKLGSDINATFVDCTFTGDNAWGYVNDATFQNCTFDSTGAAIHFDRTNGDLVVSNCTFKAGKVQIGAPTENPGKAVFNDCVFEGTVETSIWSEKGMRFYIETIFNNCEFNNRVVLAGSNGLPITFNNCTMNGGTPVYYVDNTDGIIRGGNVPAVTIK